MLLTDGTEAKKIVSKADRGTKPRVDEIKEKQKW